MARLHVFLPENVAVGILVNKFPAKLSSTRLVNPLNAVGSIWPILQSAKCNFCKLRSPCRAKTSRGRICKLLPDRSNTCVSMSISSGMEIWFWRTHSTQRLPAKKWNRECYTFLKLMFILCTRWLFQNYVFTIYIPFVYCITKIRYLTCSIKTSYFRKLGSSQSSREIKYKYQ